MIFIKTIKTFIILLVIFITTDVYAQSVSFDSTFGQNGIVIFPTTGDISRFNFDNYGNIIAIGNTALDNCLAIIKTDANGILDEDFGTNGIKLLDYKYTGIYDFKITNENKILLVGQFNSLVMMMQFNEDGSFDNSFGNNGRKIINTTNEEVILVNLENNDFLLFGGVQDPFVPYISKYNYMGEIDINFGENGKMYLTDNEAFKTFPSCIKILNDQSIIIAGFDASNSDDWELAFCKINSNGNLVTNFANSGIWKMNIYRDIHGFDEESFENFTDLIEDSNGNLIFLGNIFHSSMYPNLEGSPVYICFFYPNGTMNSNFGTDGFYYHNDADRMISAHKILQNGSKFIVGIKNYNMMSYDRIISVNSDGILDIDFGHDGVFICENFMFRDMKTQGTNKLILGGSSNNVFSIVRLNIPSDVSVKQYDNIDNTVTIFPNPTRDYLYFNSEKQFEIVDMQGKVLLKSEKVVQSVNVSHLNTGFYIIKFEGNVMKKFVKE